MSVNSSSSFLPHSQSSSAAWTFMNSCINSTTAAFTLIAYIITSILLVLPLCIYVIYLGLQRWRHQRSGVMMSHSDLFTYHMVVLELMNIVGSTLCLCGILTHLRDIILLGSFLFFININGQQSFHILTCVERYLAVVHPVSYLGLRKAKGIRIRNIIIACVWLHGFAITSCIFMEQNIFISVFSYLYLAFILAVVSFCSLSVLHMLIRPGPGEGGGGRQRIDQSKLRAFYTIMAILVVLLLRFAGNVVVTVVFDSQLGESAKCLGWLSLMWFCLPSSLVLPLLFLHRAGRLTCCRNNNESG